MRKQPLPVAYPERSFAAMRNQYQSGAIPHVDVFTRSRARDYPQNPTLTALIKRREAMDQYRRKFGTLPR